MSHNPITTQALLIHLRIFINIILILLLIKINENVVSAPEAFLKSLNSKIILIWMIEKMFESVVHLPSGPHLLQFFFFLLLWYEGLSFTIIYVTAKVIIFIWYIFDYLNDRTLTRKWAYDTRHTTRNTVFPDYCFSIKYRPWLQCKHELSTRMSVIMACGMWTVRLI